MDANITGLSAREVTERRERGEGGAAAERITKSRAQIVRENVFTLFNLLNFIIAGLLFAVGAYTNMLFLAVIFLNIAVGIAQELKAKKLVDELSILNRPGVCVRRGAKDIQIELDEVVKGDLMVLQSGNQICNDAVVVEGMLEVNESLLTGESDAVVKEAGSELYSGSSVISGKAYAKVTHVGNENYATKLANEVKKEKRVASELLGSMNKVTRFTSMLIVPLGVILFFEAFLLRQAPMREAVVSSAAALLGMLPKGLVLLISISLATGVIRLAKMKILVQNIYSLETLAHVDTLCLDKTGTITNGKLTVDTVMEIGAGLLGKALPQGEPEKLVQSYLAASDDNNATFQALKEAFGGQAFYTPAHKIPFSSKRKWGCISFAGSGSVFVGAPEKLMRKLPGELEQRLEEGCRVIIVGYVPMQWEDEAALPEEIQPLYGVVLEDTIRENTRETLDFFHREGVDVKVISGDHVKTVSMIAKRAGLYRWKDAVDLSTLGEDIDYEQICQQYAVFARVTPGQKKELVCALKRQGHQVAMTGDGVNDLLALREADCSIAVADGSDASRQVAPGGTAGFRFYQSSAGCDGRAESREQCHKNGERLLYQDHLLGAGFGDLPAGKHSVPVYPDSDYCAGCGNRGVSVVPYHLGIRHAQDTRQILKDGVIQCAAVCPHSHGDGRSHQYYCSVYGGAAADSHVFSADLYFHGSRGEELYSV